MGILIMIFSFIVLIAIVIFSLVSIALFIEETENIFGNKRNAIIGIFAILALGTFSVWFFTFGYGMNTNKKVNNYLSDYELSIKNVKNITKTSTVPIEELDTTKYKNYTVVDANKISHYFYFIINTKKGYVGYSIDTDKYSKFDDVEYLTRIQNVTLDMDSNSLYTKLYVENFLNLPKDKKEFESKEYQKYLHEKSVYTTTEMDREFLAIPKIVEENNDFVNDLKKDSKLLLDDRYKILEKYHIQKIRFE